jgi:hypothetical protein
MITFADVTVPNWSHAAFKLSSVVLYASPPKYSFFATVFFS